MDALELMGVELAFAFALPWHPFPFWRAVWKGTSFVDHDLHPPPWSD
jgi:hypothetical protein